MAKQFAKSFYNSADWKKARKIYVNERRLADGGLCEVCRTRAGEEVHHITPLTPDNISDGRVALDKSNLQLLCRECHFRTKDDSFKRYLPQFQTEAGAYFDVKNGEPKLKEQKVIVVFGAPCAGKTAYVKKHMKHGDFVLNIEDLFQSFSGDRYDLPQALFGNVCDIREYALDYIKQGRVNAKTVWVVETLPERKRRENRVKSLGAELVQVDSDYETCIANVHRNKKIKDKDLYFRLIRQWFDKYEK
jgi:hypothetical protein